MDDQPPPYEANSRDGSSSVKSRDNIQQWSLADEVAVSRARHIIVTASKIHSALENRARYGISSATMLLVPSGQIGESPHQKRRIKSNIVQDLSRIHKVVEFEDVQHTMVELAGEADSADFWLQAHAIQDLRTKVSEILNGESATGSGMFKVKAWLKDYHFRTESAFGLMETAVAKCIVIEVET